MMNVEQIVTGSSSMDLLRTYGPEAFTRTLAKTYLYLDYWGCSYRTVAENNHPSWQLGPADIYATLPYVRADKGQFPYRMDQFHDQRFAEMCFAVLNSKVWAGCRGLFIDDFDPNVRWWGLDPDEQAIVWPFGSNRPEEMLVMDAWLRALAGLRGKGAEGILFNGSAIDKGYRLWESVGKWKSREDVESAKAGDALLVYGIASDGCSWAKVTRDGTGWPIGTSFKNVFHDCLMVADKKDLRIALAYAEKNVNAGFWSKCAPHEFSDPNTWGTI